MQGLLCTPPACAWAYCSKVWCVRAQVALIIHSLMHSTPDCQCDLCPVYISLAGDKASDTVDPAMAAEKTQDSTVFTWTGSLVKQSYAVIVMAPSAMHSMQMICSSAVHNCACKHKVPCVMLHNCASTASTKTWFAQLPGKYSHFSELTLTICI